MMTAHNLLHILLAVSIIVLAIATILNSKAIRSLPKSDRLFIKAIESLWDEIGYRRHR